MEEGLQKGRPVDIGGFLQRRGDRFIIADHHKKGHGDPHRGIHDDQSQLGVKDPQLLEDHEQWLGDRLGRKHQGRGNEQDDQRFHPELKPGDDIGAHGNQRNRDKHAAAHDHDAVEKIFRDGRVLKRRLIIVQMEGRRQGKGGGIDLPIGLERTQERPEDRSYRDQGKKYHKSVFEQLCNVFHLVLSPRSFFS